MADGITLKIAGEMFFFIIAICASYGVWELFRQYRQTTSTVIKAHITAYELRKMIESRPRL